MLIALLKRGTMSSVFEEIAREAAEKAAESLGADYLFAGNIFETDCKKGLPGRGLEFLERVCKEVTIPVYAIGGITKEKMPRILETGAAGGCMMSGFMQLKNHENDC